MVQMKEPKVRARRPRWWPVVALVALLLLTWWVWNTGWLQDLTASYVKYSSAAEVADSAFVGDRVAVPLTVSSSYDNFEIETDHKGLIVEPPASGLVRGTHTYYLQIYSRQTKLGLHARSGDPAGMKTFLVAVVKRIE
jgi:hypothetical protein